MVTTTLTPKARGTDPTSSHHAADVKCKTVDSDRLTVLDYIRQYPGLTAYHLDRVLHLDGKAHRRAKELESIGWIRRPKKGTEQMIMYITELGRLKLRGKV